jgi:hypothetical protein
MLLPIPLERFLDRRHLLMVFDTQVDIINFWCQTASFALEQAIVFQDPFKLASYLGRLQF